MNTTYVETIFCYKTYKDPSTKWIQVRIYDEFNKGYMGIPTQDGKPSDCGVSLDDDLSILRFLNDNYDEEKEMRIDMILSSMLEEERGCFINGTEYDFEEIKEILEGN